MCAHEKDFVHFAAHRSLNQGAKTAGGLNLLFLAIVSSEPENGFVTISPAAKDLFPADLTEQRKKLIATLAIVVNRLSNLQSFLPAARTLTKRHVNYGAKPEHYPVVGSAVLHAGGRPRLGLDARSRLRSDGCVWHAVRLDDGRNLEHEFANLLQCERPLPRKNESGSGT